MAQSADQVARLVTDIASASREQAAGIGQITQAIAEMDRVTQDNAATAESSASFAQELSAQAQEMQAMISELKQAVLGRQKQGTSTAAARREVYVRPVMPLISN